MKNEYASRVAAKFAGLVAVAMTAVSLAAEAAEIGFTVPFEDWRTPMQIAGKHVKETFYEPVSVFTTNDELEISFGWTGKGLPVGMTPIRFSVLDEHGSEVVAWTEPASSATTQSGYASGIFWCGHLSCDILKLFTPGDYMLVAELDPANTLNEDVAARADNTTIFRFAIRDEALSLAGMMSGFNPVSVSAINGNDFAQAPHAALRKYIDGLTSVPNAPMVQFGPYVPMNGKAVSSRKKPLDLVFLVDISGSMGGCIRGLLNNIGVFIEKLMKGDADNDPIDDLRVKIVGFRDYKASWDRNTLGWYDEGSFSGNLSVLKAKLNSFSANGGGGNGGETSFDALWYVAKDMSPNRFTNPTACVPTSSPFRPKGEAARAVILFTDEAPHDPLSANGCAGLRIPDVVKAVEDAEITLTVITESLSWYSGNYGVIRFSQLADTNAYTTAARNSTYIRTSNLATFANDASALRNLAGQVLSQVDTIVVEPSLVVKSSDLGTLSFKWRNDSTADTNNVFRFSAYDGSNRAAALTNIVCTATDRWERVELVLQDGDHTFEWNYRKTGYDGAIVDAGLVADLAWEPWATQLKLKPYEFEFECDTDLSGIVEVTCNETWKTLAPSESWVHVSASGTGDGSFTFTVDPNPTYSSRSAEFKVRAGDHGNASTDAIVERTVSITQKPSPYRENGLVEIFDVGVKPRWPWNTLVDIDFRVIAPEKNTSVAIELVGWDDQGRGFTFNSSTYATRMKTQRNPKYIDVSQDESRGVIIAQQGDYAKFTCPSSGMYRVTWNLANWIDDGGLSNFLWEDKYSFHTPEFKVILKGSAVTSAAVKTLTVTSTPVRVDTRVGGNAGNIRSDSGRIITGMEKIGHPDGRIDPFPWDSTSVEDGRTDLSDAYQEAFRVDAITNKCIVLNDVKVEGGVITNDTIWMADVVHVVRDNIYILKGAKLTIDDGAVVKFCDSTKLFTYYDSSSKLWNLEVRGAYITDIFNSRYGGDTIYNAEVSSGWGMNERFFDQDFPDNGSDLYSDGILDVQLKTLDHVITNETTLARTYIWDTKWRRIYTRNQQFGNLPRPVESGEAFLGWFYLVNGDPWTQMDSRGYESVASVAMISDSHKPLVKGEDKRSVIYAVSDKPDKYDEILWPTADGGSATITLANDTFTYDGAAHRAEVTEVKVGEAVVPPTNYTLSYTDADGNEASSFRDVGVYFVKVNFLHDYVNTPSASYAILPAEAKNAEITFSDKNGKTIDSYVYSGSKLAKPSVIVKVNGRTLGATEYTLGWSDGDWTSIGKYTATVELRGNYIGTASAVFEIRENPDLEVVFYDKAADADARRAKMESDGLEPRILYLSGTDAPGNDGIATRGIKKLLKEDVAVRSFVLTNFVCRYADWGSEGSNKCATAYAPAFGGTPLPFMGGISTKTADKCIVWTNGYMSASELLSFLVVAATMPETLLPVLDAGATDAQVQEQIAKISWADPKVAASITNIAAYVKFQKWVESLDDATRDKLADSARTYISSRISDILETPYLLGDTENVALSITDFKASESVSGEYEVTVELKVGDPLSSLKLKAAKEAFAEKVRLGTSLKDMSPAQEKDIDAKATSGDKVVLTVAMPKGGSGFVTIKIE